jgi:hypothetical protein
MMLLHLVLLVTFVAKISTSFSIPVPRMCVLYHNFYYVLLSPAELAWSQVIKWLWKSDRGCPVIEISSF